MAVGSFDAEIVEDFRLAIASCVSVVRAVVTPLAYPSHSCSQDEEMIAAPTRLSRLWLSLATSDDCRR